MGFSLTELYQRFPYCFANEGSVMITMYNTLTVFLFWSLYIWLSLCQLMLGQNTIMFTNFEEIHTFIVFISDQIQSWILLDGS